jgi:FkbM family methyltransferase
MSATSEAMLQTAAFAAHEKRDFGEAERLCRTILAVSPGQMQATRLLAEILAVTNRPTEAVTLFRQIVPKLEAALATTSISHALAMLRNRGFRPSGILDVGAYRGEWTRMAHHFYPEASILMIEAQPKLDPVLEALASANPGKIDCRMALLGRERRDAVDFFQMDVPISTGSSLYAEQTRFARSIIKLPMRRLDDVIADTDGRKYQLLKLDVQGAELDVLAGAEATLTDVEVLILELSLAEYNRGAPLFTEVIAALKELDFLIFDLYPLPRTRTGLLLQVDAIFLRPGSPLSAKPPFG